MQENQQRPLLKGFLVSNSSAKFPILIGDDLELAKCIMNRLNQPEIIIAGRPVFKTQHFALIEGITIALNTL
jgi:hypothetical protein